jgi:hypothetical protein
MEVEAGSNEANSHETSTVDYRLRGGLRRNICIAGSDDHQA